MKQTGHLLKKARLKQELSISEISLATKINTKVLTAIEEGDLDSLPPKSFLRGFVRTYAKYLKMDVDSILENFTEEVGTTIHQPSLSSSFAKIEQPDLDYGEGEETSETTSESQAPQQPPQNQVQNENTGVELPKLSQLSFLNFSLPRSRIAIVGGLVVLLILVVFVNSLVTKYSKEKEVPASEPEVTAVKEQPQGQKSDEQLLVEEAEKKEQKQQDEVESANEPAVQDAQAEAEATAESDQQRKEPEPANREESQASQEEPVRESEPATKPEVPKPLDQTIIVEALDRVSLAFRIDNGDLKRIELEPDEVHTIKAKSKVAMDVSDGGAVNIIHNGRDKGVPGDLGKPIKIRFP